jgi:VCBS repeat-containing protein
MYSTPATDTSTGGAQLRYVNSAGNDTLVTTVGATVTNTYRGTAAWDGTNFWYFYSDDTEQVYGAKISGSGHSLLATYTYTGFTSKAAPVVTALPNGNFMLGDWDLATLASNTFVEVNNTGGVLEKYTVPAGQYAWMAPTSDSGALILLNYDSGNGKFDTKAIEAFGSAYLDPVPATITTPTAISIADTSANDNLANSSVATLTVSSGTTITAYGIQGGTTGTYNVGGVTYTVSKAGTYGTLYMDGSAGANGKYVYVPNSAAINQLQSNASDSFTVTVHNAASTDGSATLTVNITGVNDLPLIANLNGNAGTFKANASNPVADNDFIAPGTVAVTDVDSSNLASGYVQINQSSGTGDGYFFTDTNKVKAGTTLAGADARFSAGENVYVDVSGAGTSYVQIGTVAASGGVLHIDFNASATPANVTWLVKNLTYSAPTEGLRNFTLVVNDGDGGTSAASSFSMNGTDGTPPTLGSATPADNATGVAVATSPQVTFSEAVKFGTGKIYLFDIAGGSVVEQFDVATAQGTTDGKVSISGSTLTINPTAPLDFNKAYAIKIDNGAITDMANNPFAGFSDTTTLNFTTINNPPTVGIAAAPTSLKAGQHATISFTFSVAPIGFDATDITVTGGTLTGLAVDPGDDKLYTADFSPSASQTLNASIEVNAGMFTNAGGQGNLASNVLAISGDTLAPTIASIVRSAPAGSPTNADSLTFLVTFSEAVANVDASDFAVTGSTATVSSVSAAGGNAYSVTVSGGDLASLNATVGLSVNGASDIADTATNALSGTTPTGADQTYVVDNDVVAPTFALAADTGSSSGDGLTANGTVNVTLAADVASWEYSVDGGAHWATGTGTSFTLAEGSYASGAVQVKQVDAAGNASAATSSTSAITVDTTASAPVFALASDTGSSSLDRTSSDGTVGVALPGDAASWEYSTDTGSHWTAGTGTNFILAEGSYVAGTVKVRYTDIAGNLSAAASNGSTITIDTSAPAAAVTLAADTGASASDSITNNPTVNVTLPGDVASWQYSVNGGTDWTSGSGTSFDLADGQYASGDIKVRYTDVAGNASTVAGNAGAISVDTTAAAPSLALAADTGSSSSDGITSNGVVNITLASDVASWQYSTNGGTSWSSGSGTSFTLAAAAYAANAVQVRQTDIAGNQSTAASIAAALTIDQSAPAPTLALAADTGSSASDGLTKNPQVNVTLATDVASWEYSLDAGAHWTTGAGTSFTLADGIYAAGALRVRQTDLAGNLSAAGASAAAITIDTTTSAPAFALAIDSGKSGTDGISTSGAVNVSLPTDAASWEFSVDGGAHWSAGSGTAFGLAEGSYAAGVVRVRYTDHAGNLSTATGNPAPISIDNTAAAPALALETDTGSPADGITFDPNIRVTLPADAASWQYSSDNGAHWNTGVGTVFALAPGKYVTGSVQVRYTDIAGNLSPAAGSTSEYNIQEVPAPPPVPISVDGVPVTVGTISNPDGSTSKVISVPVVLPTRVDDTGSPSVANIPLVSGSNGAPPPLAAQVPTGFGLEVTGSPTWVGIAAAVNELVRAIQAHTAGGSSDQGALAASGSGFLSQLPSTTPLLVQAITPTISVGAPPGSPLGISAPPATSTGAVTALVIDGSSLPVGTSIELQNVNFAALIGPMRVTGGEGQQTVFGDGASQYIVLGPDDDVLHGGAGDDIVGSEGGNDRIYGDEGNDLVFGGAGNDYIDGGSGTDTVLLQGASRADYSLRFDHGNLVATQLRNGPDGIDTIANVELLRFAGASADMGAQGTLRRVYDTLFDRPADAAGTAFWAGMNARGMSMHDIAANLLSAPEASALVKMSNAAFVDRLYLDALGAQPLKLASAEERAGWVAMLDQGKTDRAGVLVGIANSTQKLSLDAQEQSQIAFANTDAATVVRLYDTVFGRLGDEAGVNYWIERSEAGVTMKVIVNAFLLSAEGQQHYANTGDDQFVDALYNVGLGRHADAAEISWWSDKLHTGVLSRSDMVLYFADSPEKVALIGHSTTIPGL